MLKLCLQKRAFSSGTVSQAAKRKIEVQLLKDFEGLGRRGEVVKVLASRMVNQLHPNNGAAFILPDQPPKIPVVKRNATQNIAPKATETPQPSIDTIKKTQKTTEVKTESAESNTLKDLSFDIDSLKIATSGQKMGEAPAENENYFRFDSLRELPELLRYTPRTDKRGFLSIPITKKDFAKKLAALTGYEFKDEELSFTYVTQERASVPIIDFVGYYEVTIKIGSYKPVSKKTVIASDVFKGDNFPIKPEAK